VADADDAREDVPGTGEVTSDTGDSAGDRDGDTVVHLPIEPAIDLHAFAPADIPSVVDEYLTAAHAAGLREVRLIHGRGRGIQRGRVQSVLERHPLVSTFWDAPESHLGATVAHLID
jgi:DNA-nicking Smr family endonuclease